MRNVLFVGNFPLKDSPLGYSPTAYWIAKTFEQLGWGVRTLNESDVEAKDVLLELGDRTYDLILCEEGRLFGDHTNDHERGQTNIHGFFKEVMDKAEVPVVPWLTNIFFGIMRRELEIDINPIFKADIVFSTDGGHEDRWKEKGIEHVCLRQGIYESESYLGKPVYPTKSEIVFVGAIYEEIWPYRKELVDFLAKTYGPRFLHVGQRGEVRHDDLNNLCATVKIVVGDSVYSPQYWSNRVYEITGRGGFLIHPSIPGLEKEFTPYEHFVPYTMKDFAGLKEKIDYYLEHETERERIRLAGFNHCRTEHTYKKRVETLIKTLEERGILKSV